MYIYRIIEHFAITLIISTEASVILFTFSHPNIVDKNYVLYFFYPMYLIESIFVSDM